MNKKLDGINMLSFIIHGMIGIELVTMPQQAVIYAKTDAWMCPLIVGVITLIAIHTMLWICEQYPDLSFVQINEKVFGKIIGKATLLIFACYGSFISGLSLRLFSESINTFILENTPIWVVMCTFLGTMYNCLKRDIRSIAIVFDMLLPFVLFFIGFLMLLSLTAADTKNILPVLTDGVIPVLKGSFNILNQTSGAYVCIFILPYFNKLQETKKYFTSGIVFSSIIYSLIVMLCIMVFGDIEILFLTFPTLTLTKAIQVNVQVIERAESLFAAAWIPVTFTTIVFYYLVDTISLKQLFNTNKNNVLIAVQIPLIYIVAAIPKNIGQLFKLLSVANSIIQFLIFIYIPLFVLMVLIKKRGGRNKKT